MLDLEPNDYDDHEDYALAVQRCAVELPTDQWGIGGSDGEPTTEQEFAIEPGPGGCARMHDSELAGLIDEMVDFRDPRLITREVTYGPWRYVTPAEIEAC